MTQGPCFLLVFTYNQASTFTQQLNFVSINIKKSEEMLPKYQSFGWNIAIFWFFWEKKDKNNNVTMTYFLDVYTESPKIPFIYKYITRNESKYIAITTYWALSRSLSQLKLISAPYLSFTGGVLINVQFDIYAASVIWILKMIYGTLTTIILPR